MRIRINPYKSGSCSAGALAQYLTELHDRAVLRLRRNTQFRPRRDDWVINYGIGHAPIPIENQLNLRESVRRASNKLRFFEDSRGQDYRVPEWTNNIELARRWIQEGHKVCCRTNLTGHSADGLVLASTEDELVQAPLYTQYVKKQQEYRVHFVGGTIVDVQRKARRADVPDEDVNWQVRNHDNGFIYARGNVTPRTVPQDVILQCEEYIGSTDLDFGSIDVLYNEREDQAYILEVNTASGLEGTTLERIGNALYALVIGEQVQPWATLPVFNIHAPEEIPEEPEEQAQPPEEVVDVHVRARALRQEQVRAEALRFQQLYEHYQMKNMQREAALFRWNDAQREMFNGRVIADANRNDAINMIEQALNARRDLDRHLRGQIRGEDQAEQNPDQQNPAQQNPAQQELRIML